MIVFNYPSKKVLKQSIIEYRRYVMAISKTPIYKFKYREEPTEMTGLVLLGIQCLLYKRHLNPIASSRRMRYGLRVPCNSSILLLRRISWQLGGSSLFHCLSSSTMSVGTGSPYSVCM